MSPTTSDLTYIQLFHVIFAVLLGIFILASLLLSLNRLLSRHRVKSSDITSRQKASIHRWLASSCPWAVRAAMASPRAPTGLLSTNGYLENLPTRAASSTSPCLGNTARGEMHQAIIGLVEENPSTLYLGRSTFESSTGGVSLYAKRTRCDGTTSYRGKVLEVSNADGTIQIMLHPADAGFLRDSGWGRTQRSRKTRLKMSRVEDGWVEVEMPRDPEEVGVIKQVVKAGLWYAWVQAGGKEEESLEGRAETGMMYGT